MPTIRWYVLGNWNLSRKSWCYAFGKPGIYLSLPSMSISRSYLLIHRSDWWRLLFHNGCTTLGEWFYSRYFHYRVILFIDSFTRLKSRWYIEGSMKLNPRQTFKFISTIVLWQLNGEIVLGTSRNAFRTIFRQREQKWQLSHLLSLQIRPFELSLLSSIEWPTQTISSKSIATV
jgi:hypothetical protein